MFFVWCGGEIFFCNSSLSSFDWSFGAGKVANFLADGATAIAAKNSGHNNLHLSFFFLEVYSCICYPSIYKMASFSDIVIVSHTRWPFWITHDKHFLSNFFFFRPWVFAAVLPQFEAPSRAKNGGKGRTQDPKCSTTKEWLEWKVHFCTSTADGSSYSKVLAK